MKARNCVKTLPQSLFVVMKNIKNKNNTKKTNVNRSINLFSNWLPAFSHQFMNKQNPVVLLGVSISIHHWFPLCKTNNQRSRIQSTLFRLPWILRRCFCYPIVIACFQHFESIQPFVTCTKSHWFVIHFNVLFCFALFSLKRVFNAQGRTSFVYDKHTHTHKIKFSCYEFPSIRIADCRCLFGYS